MMARVSEDAVNFTIGGFGCMVAVAWLVLLPTVGLLFILGLLT